MGRARARNSDVGPRLSWHPAGIVDLRINAEIVIPERDLSFSATTASGPGGQNVNKVATKVDLRFDLEATEVLSEAVKSRLRAQQRLDSSGRLIVVSDAYRSQRRNLEDAREKLRAIVLQALHVPTLRRPSRPSKASQRRRIEKKRRLGDKKRSRGSVHSDDG